MVMQAERIAVGIERSQPREADDDDAARVRSVEDAYLRLLMKALWDVTMLPAPDRVFRRNVCDPKRDMSTLSERQREQIKQLAWTYRRSLPSHLRPKFNPADPIVREAQLG